MRRFAIRLLTVTAATLSPLILHELKSSIKMTKNTQYFDILKSCVCFVIICSSTLLLLVHCEAVLRYWDISWVSSLVFVYHSDEFDFYVFALMH